MREFLAFLPYVLKTAARARVRSLGTVIGAALAMVLFTFVRVVDAGTAALLAGRGQPLLVVFQDSRFCPMTSALPLRYARTIEDLPGVASVLPTMVFVNACRSNLDLVTLHGVPADRLDDVYDLRVVAGDAAAFRGRADAALVGERLAARRGLAPGDRTRLGLVDVEVAAVVASPTAAVDNLAFVDLDQLALARRRQGSATQFLVRVADDADPDAVAQRIDATFAADEARTDTKTMQAFVAAAVGEIAELIEFARWLGYLGVAIVALLVANTVHISAGARTAELALLETVGMSRAHRAGLIVAEGVLLATLGGGVGIALTAGVLSAQPLTIGIEGHGIDIAPSAAAVGEALAVAIGIGLAASLPAAAAAVRRPLWSAIRSD